MSYFLTPEQVAGLGLASVGSQVLIDRDARLLNPQRIHLGNHVRIDAQAIRSPGPDGIRIGNHVHLSVGACLYGSGGAIVMEDFTAVSGRGMVYSATDDALFGYLHGWGLPDSCRKVTKGAVLFRRHSGIGAGSVVLPGVELGFGSGCGALSVISRSIPECAIIIGNPPRQLRRRRNRELIERLEAEVLRQLGGGRGAGAGGAGPG